MDIDVPLGFKYTTAIKAISGDEDSPLSIETDDDNNFIINWYDREPIDFGIIRQKVYEMDQEIPDPKDSVVQKFKNLGFSDEEIKLIINNINT